MTILFVSLHSLLLFIFFYHRSADLSISLSLSDHLINISCLPFLFMPLFNHISVRFPASTQPLFLFFPSLLFKSFYSSADFPQLHELHLIRKSGNFVRPTGVMCTEIYTSPFLPSLSFLTLPRKCYAASGRG